LPDAAARAVLGVALEQSRREGGLARIGRLADAPGFRRRLRGRIAAWTRAERDPLGELPGEDGPAGLLAEEWAVFGHYRGLLRQLGAEDDGGFAVWASRAYRDLGPKANRLGAVTVFEPCVGTRATRRVLKALHECARTMAVTLPWDPSRLEACSEVAPLRERLLEWGFVETRCSPDPARPAGLAGVEAALFHADPRVRIEDAAGVTVLGAPRGEGLALVVARRVADLIEECVGPEEILVLTPRWDDDVAVVLETLRSWGIGASAEATGPLANEPAVAVLRLALSVPVEDWEADRLVRLLRNGQVRPAWPEVRGPLDLPAAATAIRDVRVFRGRAAIRAALLRASGGLDAKSPRDERRRRLKAARAGLALALLDRLTALFEPVDRPAPWRIQAQRVRNVRAELRLGHPAAGTPRDLAALETLTDAIDDHGAVLEALGLGDDLFTWPDFVLAVDALARDLAGPPPGPAHGTVRLLTVDQAEGMRAGHVLLINLTEGAFPAREALTPDPADEQVDRAYAREMLRFLRVLGSAEHSLTLVYPATDEKGQSLLTAGFLDDVERLFAPDVWKRCTTVIRRLEPVLSADLAGSPRETRVCAVARACSGDETARNELRDLARMPRQRAALEGTAAALRVSAHRTARPKVFGPYDGRLHDPRVAQRIAASFAPGRPAFSPSQLESLVFCPFQFFLRYVLQLEPVDECDELDEDRTARGSLIHKALETLHSKLRDEPSDIVSLVERVRSEIDQVITGVLESVPVGPTDLDAGLRSIETIRLRRTGRRYAAQLAKYLERKGPTPVCHRFEVGFGKSGTELPCLVVGEGEEAIQIQGSIDRIDLVRNGEGVGYRVIDYKTGHCPGATEFATGLAIQLPLYAWAVERLGLAGDGAVFGDFGYWALRDEGFKPVRLERLPGAKDGDPWAAYQARLVAFLLEVVTHLRAAEFPVAPRKEDCTRTCDFSSVCRIGQVRKLEKVWIGAPRMEGPS
jgi:RecB family exonuclease